MDPYYVYLIGAPDNMVKIGYTNDPSQRIRKLQEGNPLDLYILHLKEFSSRAAAQSAEIVLHQAYKSKRYRGEWFELTREDIQEIIDKDIVDLSRFDLQCGKWI